MILIIIATIVSNDRFTLCSIMFISHRWCIYRFFQVAILPVNWGHNSFFEMRLASMAETVHKLRWAEMMLDGHRSKAPECLVMFRTKWIQMGVFQLVMGAPQARSMVCFVKIPLELGWWLEVALFWETSKLSMSGSQSLWASLSLFASWLWIKSLTPWFSGQTHGRFKDGPVGTDTSSLIFGDRHLFEPKVCTHITHLYWCWRESLHPHHPLKSA